MIISLYGSEIYVYITVARLFGQHVAVRRLPKHERRDRLAVDSGDLETVR